MRQDVCLELNDQEAKWNAHILYVCLNKAGGARLMVIMGEEEVEWTEFVPTPVVML